MRVIHADACHDRLVAETKGILAYDSSRDFSQWKAQIEDKLTELLGLNVIAENACPSYYEIEEITEDKACRKIRFCYESEKENFVPAILLIPKQDKKKYMWGVIVVTVVAIFGLVVSQRASKIAMENYKQHQIDAREIEAENKADSLKQN